MENSAEKQDIRLLEEFDLDALLNLDSLEEGQLKEIIKGIQKQHTRMGSGHSSHSSTYNSSAWL